MSSQLRKTRKNKAHKGGAALPGSVPSTSQGGLPWLPAPVADRADTLKGKGKGKAKGASTPAVKVATGVPLVLLNNWKKFAEQAIKPIVDASTDTPQVEAANKMDSA